MIMDNLNFFSFICTVLVTLQTSHAVLQFGCPKFNIENTCRENKVLFYFRNKIGNDITTHELVEEDVTTIKNANFLKDKPLKFIFHGHGENYDDFLVKPLQEEYFKLRYNVVVIDYGWLSQIKNKSCYRTGVENSNEVATCAARMIEAIIEHNEKGIKIDHFHLIGLSLGGQIVGQIPDLMIHKFQGKIPRITGIDPANEGFFEEYATDQYTLTKNDAKLVDVIHSNAGINGVLPPRGHIDWYPNGGTFQPECPHGYYLCDHISSLIYYLESIGGAPFFKIKAQWCPDLETKKFDPKSCKDLAEVPFGESLTHEDIKSEDVTNEDIKSEKMEHGVYFFETNDKFPYMREGAFEYSVYAKHLKMK